MIHRSLYSTYIHSMVAAPHIADWCVVAAPHSTTVAPPAVSISLHGEAYTTNSAWIITI